MKIDKYDYDYITDTLQKIDITTLEDNILKGEFLARCVKCYDGDSPTFVILNANNKPEMIKCRLYGIDTPEMKGVRHLDAVKSRNRLIQLLTDQDILVDKEYTKQELEDIFIKNKKICKINCIGEREKFGRVLCEIYISEAPSEAISGAQSEAPSEAPSGATSEAPSEAISEAPSEAPTRTLYKSACDILINEHLGTPYFGGHKEC